MTRFGFVGLVLVLNLLLGNVCLLGTAYAANPVDAATEELLSREVPMSFNIVTCTWIKTDEGWEPTPDSPCASGKCIKKSAPETPCLAGLAAELVAAQLPVSPTEAFVPWTDALAVSLPTESPPPFHGFDAIVMRM